MSTIYYVYYYASIPVYYVYLLSKLKDKELFGNAQILKFTNYYIQQYYSNILFYNHDVHKQL